MHSLVTCKKTEKIIFISSFPLVLSKLGKMLGGFPRKLENKISFPFSYIPFPLLSKMTETLFSIPSKYSTNDSIFFWEELIRFRFKKLLFVNVVYFLGGAYAQMVY